MPLSGPPRLSVFTLFPDLIEAHARTSVLGRAVRDGLVEVIAHDLRSHGVGGHEAVDDAPFGGGAGMVLAPGPIFDAIEARLVDGSVLRPVIALGPKGRPFTQKVARELSSLIGEHGGFSLVCGRYEGFDERIHQHLFDDELSLGDFVLGGGEVAAMAVVEAVARLIPGVMGNETSAMEESFSVSRLEYPQYTRPASFRGWDVPEVLRSGDHARVARWRLAMAVVATFERRPDLLVEGAVSDAEAAALKEFGLVIPGVEWPPDRPKRNRKRASEPVVHDGRETD